MKLIQVTNNLYDEVIGINPEHIVYMVKYGERSTLIKMVDSYSVVVNETMEEIVERSNSL